MTVRWEFSDYQKAQRIIAVDLVKRLQETPVNWRRTVGKEGWII